MRRAPRRRISRKTGLATSNTFMKRKLKGYEQVQQKVRLANRFEI